MKSKIVYIIGFSLICATLYVLVFFEKRTYIDVSGMQVADIIRHLASTTYEYSVGTTNLLELSTGESCSFVIMDELVQTDFWQSVSTNALSLSHKNPRISIGESYSVAMASTNDHVGRYIEFNVSNEVYYIKSTGRFFSR